MPALIIYAASDSQLSIYERINFAFKEGQKDDFVCLFEWSMFSPAIFFDMGLISNIIRWFNFIAINRSSTYIKCQSLTFKVLLAILECFCFFMMLACGFGVACGFNEHSINKHSSISRIARVTSMVLSYTFSIVYLIIFDFLLNYFKKKIEAAKGYLINDQVELLSKQRELAKKYFLMMVVGLLARGLTHTYSLFILDGDIENRLSLDVFLIVAALVYYGLIIILTYSIKMSLDILK